MSQQDAANSSFAFHPESLNKTASLKQLVDFLPLGAMLVCSDARILLANDLLNEILGYESDELVDEDVGVILPSDYQENHAAYIKSFFQNPHKRTMGEGETFHVKCKSGRLLPIEMGMNPLVSEDSPMVLVTLVDLSPKRRATTMFQRSIQVAPHGVLVVDSNGIIQLANSMLCQYFGYQLDEIIKQPLDMLLPERYRQHHTHLRQSFHANPMPRTMGAGRDLTALHKDGREFPVEIGLSPFEDEQNQNMVFVSLLDITERKRMEQALRETNKNLEEFTYVASHDLRSPLRGIADLLEWIKEDLEPNTLPDVSNNLDRIDIRIKRMEQLIDNLLTYAKAGKKDAIAEEVDVNLLLDRTIDLLEVPASLRLIRDIQLTQLTAFCTPLETVLRNLISNAIKHHDTKVGSILIRSQVDHNFCHFSICDDGPGIPEAAHERIFRLFQTVTSSERSGTGIGLSVSRRLVETHGGRICVETNQPRRGVTFHVWWPRFIRKDNHD